MIITLTLNPSVDQTVFVRGLEVGQVNRFHESQLDPAGKGINVSRMVHRLGWPTIAFGFLGGEIGRLAEHALENEGVPYHFVQVPGQTRLNVTIVDEATNSATSLYGPGPAVDCNHLDRLSELIRFWLKAGKVLVLAGSLPKDVPNGLYAEYIKQAHEVGLEDVILDTDGEGFRLGVAAKPFLIKPNVSEAERMLGRSLPDLAAIACAAREIQDRGIAVVVISMGGQGAVCASGGHVWHVVPPKVQLRSTVGSGDSLVAGLAVARARGDEVIDGLRLGTAAGAATAMTAGTSLGHAEDVAALVPQVEIHEIG